MGNTEVISYADMDKEQYASIVKYDPMQIVVIND